MDEQIVLALQTRGSSRCSLGDWGGLDDLYEARRRAREIGVGHEIVRSHNNLGSFVLYLDGSDSRARDLQSRHRDRRAAWPRRVGALGEGAHGLDAVRHSASGTSYSMSPRSWWRGIRLTAAVTQLPWRCRTRRTSSRRAGIPTPAAALVDDFMDRAREIADPQVVAPAAVAAAFIEHVRGDGEAALAFVREYENATRVRPVFRSRFLAEAVRVCAAESGAGRAEALTRGVVADTARSRAALATARLVIAEAQERLEEPAAEFAEVAGAWEVQGCQVERAHTLLLGGRCLVGLGRGGEAARPLSEATSRVRTPRGTPARG